MSSAGKTARVGAAALAVGLSLAGPGAAGPAAAETGDTGPVTTAPAGETTDSAAGKTAATRAGTAARRTPDVAAAGRVAARTSEGTRAARVTRGARPSEDMGRPAPRRESGPAPKAAVVTADVPPAPANGTTSAEPTVVEPRVVAPTSAVPAISAAARAAVDSAPVAVAVAGVAVNGAAAAGDIISTLFGPIQSFIEGIGLLIRRTFFNQAPTVDPVQLTGKTSGPITGTLNASDPEGDPLSFEVIDPPSNGRVTIGADGNFVYEPGPDFSGRDSFNVAVTDGGFHINLLDPFRPASTEAYVQVAQSAVQAMLTFMFSYGSGSRYWSAAARQALESSAEMLAAYLVVTSPTTITYSVTAEDSPTSSTLASAGSDLSGTGSGFFATVVQTKIQTGVDANGSAPDGDIDFNFGNPWAYGSLVGRSEYDFTSTAMHELMHSFGFLSYTYGPGDNTGRQWTTFDQFMVTADGTPVISDTYRWRTAYDANLIGGNGGLYFGGANAVAAYGGYVPLYTPDPWEEGSSVSHLDDFTFTGVSTQLMNAVTDTGLGIRVLSPVELGILKDLGYNVTDAPMVAFVFIGFGLLRRRTRQN